MSETSKTPRRKAISSESPMHMVLIADDSGSMAGRSDPSDPDSRTAAEDATEAIQNWVAELQLQTKGKKPYFRFTLISFGSQVDVIAQAKDINAIDASTFELDGSSGTSRLDEALSTAASILAEEDAPEAHCPPFVFVFTDGKPDSEEDTLREAQALKKMRLRCGAPRVVALGFGDSHDELMGQIATSREFWKRIPDAQALVDLLPRIGTPTKLGGGGATVDQFEAQIAQIDVKDI